MNGLIQRVEAGIQKQTFAQLMGFRVEEAEEGRVVISCERRADLLQQTGLALVGHQNLVVGVFDPAKEELLDQVFQLIQVRFLQN